MGSGLGVVLHSHSTTTSHFPDPLSRAFTSFKADLSSNTLAMLAPSLAAMALTTPITDARSVGVTTASAHSLPHARFDCSPERHGLNRCATKSLDEPILLLAIVNTLAFRFEKLSVSEDVDSTVSPTATTEAPVNTATSTEPTDLVTVKDSGRRKRLVQVLSNRLKDHSKRIKGGLKKAFSKYGKTKKARGCIAPSADHRLSSQSSFAEDEYVDVGQITQALGGLSISDAIEATGGPKFHGMFTVEIWRSLAAVDPSMAQLSSSTSSSTVAVTPTGGDTNTKIMDEDFPLQGSPRPTSPAATAVEHGSAQSPSPEYPSSASPAVVATVPMDEDIPAQEPLRPTSSVTTLGPEQYMGRKQDRDVPEPKDTDMAEEESRPNNIEVVQQPQNDGSNMDVDPSSTADPSSDSNESTILPKALTPEVTMEDATGSQCVNPLDTPPGSSSALPIQPAPSSPHLDAGLTSPTAQELVPATTSNIAALRQETQLAQPLPVSTANGAMEPESPLEGDSTRELEARVVPIEPSVPATTPTPTPEPIATPPSAPTHLPTGPSTGSSGKRDPVPTSHAARVHQVQAKMREAKSASKPVQSPANDEASEEAEVDDFLAKYNLGRHRRPVKLLPPPPAPISKPKSKQSKGDASRSLMSDLMAGFTSVIKPTSPGKQAPVAAPAQRPAAPNVPSSRPAAVQSHKPLPHGVAGRQAGLPSLPPNQVGRRAEVVASQGSVIPYCRAPLSAPIDGMAKGPAASHSTPSDASSSAAMDGVVNGQRAVKGSRRVARAMAKTGLTWQTIQQNAQDSQSALERELKEPSSVPTPITGPALYQEAVMSGAWHAAQPPPPPDAIPFIRATLDDDDDDDLEKALDRALS